MKKLFLFSLILVLIGVMILPAVAAPKSAEAWSGTVTIDPGELYFRVYEGVPTYLLGFIPLDPGQTLTLTHAGGFLESAGWTVTDDAGWLNQAPLFGVVGCLNRNQDVTVRVNTKGLTAGTYTATITFKFTTCATKTIAVPVTVDVIEPKVMGPLGIGVDGKLLKNVVGGAILEEENEYSGFVVNLLTNPDDAMDMQAIETDGCWNLHIMIGDEIPGQGVAISGGTLTINGEGKQIVGGGVGEISMLMAMMGGSLPIPPDFAWGENYAALFATSDGAQYIGILLADLPTLLTGLPELMPLLGGLFPGEEETSLPAPTGKNPKNDVPSGPVVNEPSPELVIPLKPILNLLPTLMPVMVNLLSNETVISLINIVAPLTGLIPPIMILIPMDVLMELMAGLM